jgi:4'-phosphopantetheinyl transferase
MTATIEIWYALAEDLTTSKELSARCEALLTPEERKKHAAFRFDKNKIEYLLTRALAHASLGTYLAAPAGSLAFVRNEYGRPQLSPRAPLHFNLTNTVQLVACAVSRDHEVGVDAEPLDRGDTVLEIAETVFRAPELAAMQRLPLEARRRRAVALWTLKEAYMKARGMGMSIPPLGFELGFDEATGRANSLSFFPPVEDRPGRWALATIELEGHLVSVCVETSEAPTIVVRRADLATMIGR